MTKVILSKKGESQFREELTLFTEEDKVSLRYWISFVERYGIEVAQENTSFRDHALDKDWNGYRAASFGFSARVIYRVLNKTIELVEIERITKSHNYRAKR